MNLDITLSINRRPEAQHNTFILRWNSAVSSYTMEHLDSDMSEWSQDGWCNADFEWSVYEWHRAHVGDRFFMVHVGEGNTGIFAAGRFTSDPYKANDRSDNSGDVYCMKMEFEAVFHPERSEIITAEDLEPELPYLDLLDGHSGQMLDKEDAVRLELMWRDFVGRNKSMLLPRAVKNGGYDSRSDIDKAIALASKAHAADYDLDGNPTILHPLAVGMMGRSDAERIVGFLHDVVEDTRYGFDDLVAEGFSKDIIAALRLLTHDKATPYMEYIANICHSGDMTAVNVKVNDLRHNLARGREGGHHHCVERHTEALRYIEEYLSGCK